MERRCEKKLHRSVPKTYPKTTKKIRKMLLEGPSQPKRSQNPSKSAQEREKSPKCHPKVAQDPPRRAQEGPKTPPRPLQEAIYVATRERTVAFLSLNGPSWLPRAPKSPPRVLQDRFLVDFFTILPPKITSQRSFLLTFSPSHQHPRPNNTAQTKQDRTAQPTTAKHHNTHTTAPTAAHHTADKTTETHPHKCIRPRGSHPTYGPLLGTLGDPKWCPRG